MLMSCCPACGMPLAAQDEIICTSCGADMSAASWASFLPASMRRRLIAAGLDHLCFTLLLLLFQSLHWLPTKLGPWQVLLHTAFYCAYFSIFALLFGTSPAKALLRMSLIDAHTGQALRWWQALLREGPGRFLCIFLSPIGYAPAAQPFGRCRTLADLLASTAVVVKRKGP